MGPQTKQTYTIETHTVLGILIIHGFKSNKRPQNNTVTFNNKTWTTTCRTNWIINIVVNYMQKLRHPLHTWTAGRLAGYYNQYRDITKIQRRTPTQLRTNILAFLLSYLHTVNASPNPPPLCRLWETHVTPHTFTDSSGFVDTPYIGGTDVWCLKGQFGYIWVSDRPFFTRMFKKHSLKANDQPILNMSLYLNRCDN